MLIAFSNLLFCLFAQAHNTGHGAKIEGLGPQGGQLTAIVAAAEAELGDKAKTAAIAEWKIEGDTFKFWILNSDKKAEGLVNGPAEIKYIVIAKTKGTEIIKSQIEGTPTNFEYQFASSLLKKSKLLEVILPNLGRDTTKHVFAVQLP